MSFLISYCVPCVWGLVLLASWMGWGDLVRRALRVERDAAGWGLRAGWGMASVLGIGGFLQLARICNGATLSVVVYAGLGVFLGDSLMRLRDGARPGLRGAPIQRLKPYLPVIILLGLIYLLSVKAFYLNDWDDYPAYLPFAKNLLQTGVIDQPFSLRRVLTFGGQQMLQAMLFIHASFRNVDILEMGLSRIIFVGLVAGLVRPQGRKGPLIAGLFLAGLALAPRGPHLPIENVHSEMTGVVLFLTLLRTSMLAVGRPGLWRFACMAAVIGAAVSSMRANYLPAAVFMIAFYYLGRLVLDRSHWKMHLGHLLLAAAVFAVILLSWSLVLYQTSGTLLNPVWLGNQNPQYNFSATPLSLLAKAWWLVGFVLSPMRTDPMPMGFVMCLPLAMLVSRRYWRVELPLAVAAGLTGVMTLLAFTNAWYDTMYRYIFPVTFGITVALLYRALMEPYSVRQRQFATWAALLLAIAHVPLGLYWVAWNRNVVPNWRIAVEKVEADEPAYRAAQVSVPAGAKVFVATSFPVLFDYARNPIVIADVPGGASPAPGMPILEGGEAVAKYLKGQGIEYVIFNASDDIENMYSRSFWNRVRDHQNDAEGSKERPTPDILYAMKFNLAFIASMDELGATQKVLHRGETLCVMQLK